MLRHPSNFTSIWRQIRCSSRAFGLLPLLVLAVGGVDRLHAGGDGSSTVIKPFYPTNRPSQPVRQAPVVRVVPAEILSDEPYLTVVGPSRVRVTPVSGRARKAPPLPTPKPAPTPEPGKDARNLEHRKPQASEFSPDAPPVLLPEEPATEPAPPVVPKEEPKESVLSPGQRKEADLRDAVIYFETPVGPNGANVSVPVPLQLPPIVALPESRATYRKEKE